MRYSYTQISHYLACPRRYRYHYLEGWEERRVRAALLFGCAFQKAVEAHFLGQNAHEVLQQEWTAARDLPADYAGDSWQHMLEQGRELLEHLARESRVQVPEPRRKLQVDGRQLELPANDNQNSRSTTTDNDN